MPEKKTERRTASRAFERVVIECVTPELDAGRHPVKRILGDLVEVGADIYKEGHDLLAARLLVQGPGENRWRQVPMAYDFDTDRWYATFEVDRIGRWCFTVEGWTDAFGTWLAGLRKKVDAGVDVRVELLEGAALVRQAARRARFGNDRATLLNTAAVLEDEQELSLAVRTHRALDTSLPALMREHWAPRDLTRYRRELAIQVDRPRAGYASWYEMFPRSNGPLEEEPSAAEPSPDAAAVPSDASAAAQSQGAMPQPRARLRHGTFATAAEQLPRIAELGFDVVYLPPIHPIGHSFRKGKNNSLTPAPDDVGSPWAIGSEAGGHDAVAPELGTIDDFDRFVQRARELGMEVALDYALQCSPDHPWVKEHPDWFHIRPDGSIAYAENPPKKYQDIYPLDFWCEDRQALWEACRDVLLFWIGHGVSTFRVDNPHTKAFAFWEWCIREVQERHPEAIFLAEAFTRPKKMYGLAKLGFTMSYTHFTWKNAWWELRPYLEELTTPPLAEYFRGNLFANTPDILNEYLVHGGRPAFRTRLLLAGTLLPLYGIYSGFELAENVPVTPGSEEYLDSEKYQLRWRDYTAPGNLNDDVRRLNALRRDEPALQLTRNLTFHVSENPEVLFYRKAAPGRTAEELERHARWLRMAKRSGGSVPAPPEPVGTGHDLLIAVNLDPHRVQETMVHVPLEALGIAEDAEYRLTDLLTGAQYTWRGRRNYVRLDPQGQAGHVLRVER
ncbi:MAG: alpha-1,4-glucan--maltose-1-phosphate maltosyltransferase [Gemmatimonadaceae bacterium]